MCTSTAPRSSDAVTETETVFVSPANTVSLIDPGVHAITGCAGAGDGVNIIAANATSATPARPILIFGRKRLNDCIEVIILIS
jgi:hypothetical protein